MAGLIAKECFIQPFQSFLGQLCDRFPRETKHCQAFFRVPIEKCIRWERRKASNGSWMVNEAGQILEFRVVHAPDEQLIGFMKYLCDQFYPYEEELLQLEINLKFFKHPENHLIKHLNLLSVWKVASLVQKQWIWRQLNMLYLVAVSLKKLPNDIFVHFHKLLDSTTQGLLAGQESKVNIRGLRDQAMEILKDVGEEKFTALMKYFFMLLQSPYSPIPELVPPNCRSYANKFLGLLRSPEGIKIIRRGMTPFLKTAQNDWHVPIVIPKERELVGEDGKMDEKKMTSAFKNIVENVLNAPESVFQKLLDNKEDVMNKISGTWQSLITPKEKNTILDDDSDDDEWVKDEDTKVTPSGEIPVKLLAEPEEEEEEETDFASTLLEVMSMPDNDYPILLPANQ